jgi:biopolymer transport protein ExbB
MNPDNSTIFFYFNQGGPLMWVILACSVISIGIGIYRFIYITSIENASKIFIVKIKDYLLHNQIIDAIDLCNKNFHLITAQIFKTGIENHSKSKEEIREIIEDVANKEIPKLESWLAVIGTITALGPLLGLLGTIIGMVQSFQKMQIEQNTQLDVIAGGIWTALLTTVAGLIVGIISLILYNYLSRQVNKLVSLLQYKAAEMIYWIRGEELLTYPEKTMEPNSEEMGSANL